MASTSLTGLEITPYINPYSSEVQDGTGSCDILEKGVVLEPNPLFVLDLSESAIILQAPDVKEQKTRRRRRLINAKVVSVSYVSFDYFKSCEDPVRFELRMYEVGSVPEILPFHGLLRNWKRETRVRPSGAQDKFYFHPTCKRMFRSLVEVTNFISSSTNKRCNEKDANPEVIQGSQQVELSETSKLINEKKRKNNGFPSQNPNSKKRRIFPVSGVMKLTDNPLALEKFLADAYENLMNLPPSIPDEATIEMEKKINVEAFLLDAQENLLKRFKNKEISVDPTGGIHRNGSSEAIKNELSRESGTSQVVQAPGSSEPQQGINPEAMNPQQGENSGPLIKQQNEDPKLSNSQEGGNGNADNNIVLEKAGMNTLTDEEKEVVRIFTQALSKGNNDEEDIEELTDDYSYFLVEPIPPRLF